MNEGKFAKGSCRPTPEQGNGAEVASHHDKIAPFQELIIRRLRRRAEPVVAQGEIRAESLPCRCEIIPVSSRFRIAR